MLHEQHNEKATCNADREAKNIDERVQPVARQIAQRDFDIIGEHDQFSSMPNKKITMISRQSVAATNFAVFNSVNNHTRDIFQRLSFRNFPGKIKRLSADMTTGVHL
jgi:hypothetical protein